ncbi:imidazolonepropionase [bacterium]|nr:imidazolonepropionase [candidate division CSSED10-310 bacterium]
MDSRAGHHALDLWIHSASELICVATPGETPVVGSAMNSLKIMPGGSVGIIAGKIACVGDGAIPPESCSVTPETRVIDASGCVVTPGLIDCHTHTVFAGTRADEFVRKIHGVSYMEIARTGGGIRRTVRETTAAPFRQLVDDAVDRLQAAMRMGITTVEIKSGYGLDEEQELRILRAARAAGERSPVRVVTTLLAAHEVPEYGSREEYLERIVAVIIPRAAAEGLADFCDVFCEQGVYSVEESRRVLAAAREYGLGLKIHAEQLTNTGGTVLAGELEACSADHLDYIDEQGIRALAEGKVIPVLLPGCTFFMGLKHYPPARRLLDADLPVALATDFNPGSCMTQNLPLIMTIACTQLRMTPSETLAATTVNAAAALDLDREIGLVAPGYQADLVMWDAPCFDHVLYHFGANHARKVIIDGEILVDN